MPSVQYVIGGVFRMNLGNAEQIDNYISGELQALLVRLKAYNIDLQMSQGAVVYKISELTEEMARQWLMDNDYEAAEFWSNQPEGGLVEAVRDNLRDFGKSGQAGNFVVQLD